MAEQTESNRLGNYLQARRGLVTPDQAGLPKGTRRRVPGLRREEVAMLAGISPDYYLRLERGRDHSPSPQVVEAIARVLQLDHVETQYFHDLVAPRRKVRRKNRLPRVPARLHHLLAAMDVPAFVEGSYFDVLASNHLARALNPRLRPGENRLRSLLLDPEEQRFQQDWEQAVGGIVAAFRHNIGDDVSHPRAVELVGELSLISGRFRELWARHDVMSLDGGTATVNHPVVGDLRLHRDKLPLGDLLLVLYYPDEHSDSAGKLQLLASLDADLDPGAAPPGAEAKRSGARPPSRGER